MSHGILVPSDGSTLAARVLPYAIFLAQRFDAELTLAQAVELDFPPSPEFSLATGRWERVGHAAAQAAADAEGRLDALREDLARRGLRADATVQAGPPARVLLEEARQRQAALIVMATHGRTGLSHWALGSVAERVLRRSHLPVLLLTPRALDAGPPERLLGRLLVPLDGSALSTSILPVAGALAGRLHAPVTLVRAVGAVEELSPAATDLRRTLAALQHEGPIAPEPASDVVVTIGAPADVIDRCAAESEAGWIALASHGRGDLGGFVLGSVTLAVLRHTDVPLLIVAQPPAGSYRLGQAAA